MFCGAGPSPAADAPVGLRGFCSQHNEPGEGARRGSGEPPHKLVRICLRHGVANNKRAIVKFRLIVPHNPAEPASAQLARFQMQLQPGG